MGLAPSVWGNPYKIGRGGSRGDAVELFARDLGSNKELLALLPQLEGRLVACHCRLREQCHADRLLAAFEDLLADQLATLDTILPEDEEVREEARRRRAV